MKKTIMFGSKLLAMTTLAAVISGCGQPISDGNFAIERHFWTKAYLDDIIDSGRAYPWLNSLYELAGKEMLLTLPDVMPKDKEGVLIPEMDIAISVRLLKNKEVIDFIKNKSDMVYDQSNEEWIIGKKYILKDAQSVLTKVIQNYSSEDLLNKKEDIEEAFKKALQEELNKFYGKIFAIGDVKFTTIKLHEAIEAKIQTIAVIKAEEEKNKANLLVLQGRTHLEKQEALALKRIADESGLSIDQLIQIRTIAALKDSGDLTGDKVRINTPAPGKR